MMSSWCTCLDDGLENSDELHNNIQSQIFEYFQSTVRTSEQVYGHFE